MSSNVYCSRSMFSPFLLFWCLMVLQTKLGGFVDAAFELKAKIVSPTPLSNTQFGTVGALANGQLIVLAYFENVYGSNSGAVYVYKESSGIWAFDSKLVPSDGKAEDRFGGNAVMFTDDINKILVSATRGDGLVTQAGCVYEFTRSGSTWIQSANKIFASDGAPLVGFGASMVINGDTLIVGSSLRNNRVGGAYVFVRNSSSGLWYQNATLLPDDDAPYQVGHSAAFDGDMVALGSGADGPGGVVYIYLRSDGTWKQEHKITPDYPRLDFRFGITVSLSGDILAVGGLGRALRNPLSSSYFTTGAAHVYKLGTDSWTEVANIRKPRSVFFGTGVGANGLVVKNNTLLLSAAISGVGKGGVFVYRTSDGGETWNEDQTVTTGESKAGLFVNPGDLVSGVRVAFDGVTLAAGSSLYDFTNGTTTVSNAGAVYLFE